MLGRNGHRHRCYGKRLAIGRVGGLELAFTAGVHDVKRLPARASCQMHIVQLSVRQFIFPIDQHSDRGDVGDEFAQELKPLGSESSRDKRCARDVSAGSVETCHQAVGDRVATIYKYDRYGPGGRLRRARGNRLPGQSARSVGK